MLFRLQLHYYLHLYFTVRIREFNVRASKECLRAKANYKPCED